MERNFVKELLEHEQAIRNLHQQWRRELLEQYDRSKVVVLPSSDPRGEVRHDSRFKRGSRAAWRERLGL